MFPCDTYLHLCHPTDLCVSCTGLLQDWRGAVLKCTLHFAQSQVQHYINAIWFTFPLLLSDRQVFSFKQLEHQRQ